MLEGKDSRQKISQKSERDKKVSSQSARQRATFCQHFSFGTLFAKEKKDGSADCLPSRVKGRKFERIAKRQKNIKRYAER
ncbi:MAG: hypothetical protein J6T94_03250 [Bacteroidaceae bacterium]|nr:hypothetical protein [Bacteroidaceae bacterium]